MKRNSASLNGLWNFVIDPHDRGEDWAEYWKEHADPSHAFMKGFDVIQWDQVTVPSSWNREGTGLEWYQGIGWYARHFELADYRDGKRSFLRFESVNYRASVWLNGSLLGTHEGGYTPFEFECTGAVRTGKNYLCVSADNRMPRDSTVPVVGWMNYGGIIRDVSLYSTGPGKIAGITILSPAPEQSGRGEITVAVKACGAAEPDRYRAVYTVKGPGGGTAASGSVSIAGDGDTIFTVAVSEPELWSPENPALYRLELELFSGDGDSGPAVPSDRITETFGFRTVGLSNDGFSLNGERIYIRGISRHDEHPAYGRTVPENQIRSDLEDIKRLGMNAVRLVHYPHDPKVLDLADQLGLLVWCEPPVYWHADFSLEKTRKLYLQQTGEMVTRDINHPSVFVWGVGNEIHTQRDETVSAMAAVQRMVTRLDSTRPSVFASWFLKPEENRALDLFPCVCVNKYAGWYGENMDRLADDLRNLHAHQPDKPVLISEFGAGAIRGIRGPDTERWNEDYQSRVILENLKTFKTLSFVAGFFIWTYADFKDPSRVHSIYEANCNNKGITDLFRRPKKAYRDIKAYLEESE
ncbi:MAG: glycoside hydrolase family 2 protein [Spirochaetia bacterium]